MFTGIVQGMSPIHCVENRGNFTVYSVELDDAQLQGLQPGASIAIDGVCQTVVEIKGNEAVFHAIDESLRCTTLCDLYPGKLVNVERSMKVGDEIGGHVLSGHVFGMSVVMKVDTGGENRKVTFSCPEEWTRYLVPKGFVALDGVSLTVDEVKPEGSFSVHFIPETLRRTTLGNKKEGDKVNVEFHGDTQVIVDTVERYMRRQKDSSQS